MVAKLIIIPSPFHGKSQRNPPSVHEYYLSDCFKTRSFHKDQIKYVLLTQSEKMIGEETY